MITKEVLRHKLRHNVQRLYVSVKWIVFSILSGVIVGGCGVLFAKGLARVTQIRLDHPDLIFLLPFGGLVIVFLYRLLRDEKDSGTNLIISSIQSKDEPPAQMAPLIFISTLITHLLGGSAGREGAAIQMGGSLGNTLGKLFHFDEKDKHVMIMCGMSAAFSALFGTPMAASIFSIEMISVGVMYYNALMPCVISSLVAHGIAIWSGVHKETFIITEFPAFRIPTAAKISVLAALCAVLSILFCVIVHMTGRIYKKLFSNAYRRIFIGGCAVITLTLLLGSQMYSGTGTNIIAKCIDGSIHPDAFAVKMLLTALTLGAGFKGGEIVPSFCTGAAFGCLFGNIFHFSPTLCTAVGMTSVFCGVTNCPITALLISFELFGYEGMPYFLLTTALSYTLSGYFGLYTSQRIIYSKYKTNYINKPTI